MAKRTVYTILGAIVAVSPLLGVPQGWKNVLLVLCGIAIVGLAQMRKRTAPEQADAVSIANPQ